MPTPELKPCPFCGETPFVYWNADGDGLIKASIAHRCPAEMWAYGNSVEEAVSKLVGAWNRRAGEEGAAK